MGHTPILSVLLRPPVHDWYCIEFTAWALHPYSRYYSVYLFMTRTTSSLLHGSCSHTPSTTLSNSSRLVIQRVYYMGLALIFLILLCLLVNDVEFTTRALLSYSHYYSVYWSTTGITSSLLHGPCSHTPITTPSSISRLVLGRVYVTGLAARVSVLLRL
jgi:hypothetical protein